MMASHTAFKQSPISIPTVEDQSKLKYLEHMDSLLCSHPQSHILVATTTNLDAEPEFEYGCSFCGASLVSEEVLTPSQVSQALKLQITENTLELVGKQVVQDILDKVHESGFCCINQTPLNVYELDLVMLMYQNLVPVFVHNLPGVAHPKLTQLPLRDISLVTHLRS